MAEVKWIKIVTDIFDDEKILLIESLPDSDAIIVIWFKLLCFAGKQNNKGVLMLNDRIAYTDEMLATIFRRKKSTVKMALQVFEDFGMIEIVDGVITIPNWGKHQNMDRIEAKNAYMRNYMQNYREKQKALTYKTNSKVNDETNCKTNCKTNDKTNSKANVSEADKEKEKDKEEDKENNKNNVHSGASAKQITNTEINDFFDSVWNLYPVKKGKGQVSDSKRRALYKIGFEEISRAIDRYLTELQKDAAWRKPQNGSTFFNSGYVDYLDDNFVPDKKPEAQANTYQQQSSYLDAIRNRVKMIDEWYADESDEPTMWDLIDEKEE